MTQIQTDLKHLQQIADFIQRDLQASSLLLSLIQQERELLIKRERKALLDVVEQKNNCLDQLDQSRRERHAFIQSMGFEPTEASWKQVVESVTADKIVSAWSALKDNLAQCKQANEVNGKMLARSRASMGRLLNILRGQVESPELYTSKGHTRGQCDSNTSIQA